MSISNNIDGSVNGANQLLDLLSAVSNPAVYESKVKALQDATAEYNKAIALVGPAKDILAIRDEIEAERTEAKEATEKAKIEATKVTAEAKVRAGQTIDDANEQAARTIASANTLKAEAEDKLAEAASKALMAEKAKLEADKVAGELSGKVAELEKAIADNEAAKLAYGEAKAEVIAKHKAFIESL